MWLDEITHFCVNLVMQYQQAVFGSSNSIMLQDWFFRSSLVIPRGFEYNTTQNLNENKIYKGLLNVEVPQGCLDQYLCRGIRLWNSWDHEVA